MRERVEEKEREEVHQSVLCQNQRSLTIAYRGSGRYPYKNGLHYSILSLSLSLTIQPS